jgi:hypothetical protein
LGNHYINEQYRQTLKDDVQLQNIWPFSSYGPDKSSYPPVQLITGHEYSFEELRWLYHQALQSGTVPNFCEQMQTLWQQSQQARQQVIQQPSKAFDYMINILAAHKASLPLSSSTSATRQQQSVFAVESNISNGPASFGRSSSAPTTTNVLTGTVFGQTAAFAPASLPAALVPQSLSAPLSAPLGQQQLSMTFASQPSSFNSSTALSFGGQHLSTSKFSETTGAQDGMQTISNAIGLQAAVASTSVINQLSEELQLKWGGDTFEFGAIPEEEPPEQVR